MLKQKKINWTLLIIAFAILAIAALGFWYVKSNQNALFIEVNDISFDLSGSRFIMDGYKVGTLKNSSTSNPNQKIYKVILDQTVNIPDNSKFYLRKDDQSRIIVDVVLQSSANYLQLGDTIRNLDIDTDLPSAIISDESNKEVTVEDSLSVENRKEVVPVEQKIEMANVEFRIQIIASREKLPSGSPFFKGQKGIKEFEENSWYKYFFGPYSSLSEAQKKQTEIMDKGFKDAFITAYRGNHRISMSELKK